MCFSHIDSFWWVNSACLPNIQELMKVCVSRGNNQKMENRSPEHSAILPNIFPLHFWCNLKFLIHSLWPCDFLEYPDIFSNFVQHDLQTECTNKCMRNCSHIFIEKLLWLVGFARWGLPRIHCKTIKHSWQFEWTAICFVFARPRHSIAGVSCFSLSCHCLPLFALVYWIKISELRIIWWLRVSAMPGHEEVAMGAEPGALDP